MDVEIGLCEGVATDCLWEENSKVLSLEGGSPEVGVGGSREELDTGKGMTGEGE